MSQKSSKVPAVVDIKEGAKEKERSRSKTPTKKKNAQTQQNIIDNKATVKIINMDLKENTNGQAKKQNETKDVTLVKGNNQEKEGQVKEIAANQNGDRAAVSNGNAGASKTNGKVDVKETIAASENGTANNKESGETADEEEVVAMEQENDEMFPELRYEEASDSEGNFESSTPDHVAAGRSITRRSQVKSTRTPETPKPVGNGRAVNTQPEVIPEEKEPQVSSEGDFGEPKDATVTADDSTIKILKLKDGPLVSSPMKLRSSDSPVPADTTKGDNKELALDQKNDPTTTKDDISTQAKSDTNFSKSRIKVSPYRRSMRKNEQQTNGSGSEFAEPSMSQMDERPSTSEDSLLENQDRSTTDFRTIKGRRSYKQLREVSLRNLSMQRQRREAAKDKEDADTSNIDSVNATTGSDIGSVSSLDSSTVSSALKNRYTPIGTVIGRKRRPSPSPEGQDVTVEAYLESLNSERMPPAKRTRFFDRMTERVSAGVTPIRRFLRRGYTVTNTTPLEVRVPEEYRDVAEVEYMSIVPPSESSPMIADPSPSEPSAEKLEPAVAEIVAQCAPEMTTATVQPNRRCAIM